MTSSKPNFLIIMTDEHNPFVSGPVELFDVESDPGEFQDLANDPAYAAVTD